jgi:hypothetical protein
VHITKSLRILLVLTAASSMSGAMAQGRSTMSLFGTAPIDPPQGQVQGMRPETVGEVAYFSLSVDAQSKLHGLTSGVSQVQIALPGGNSVTCTLRSQAQPSGILLLTGAPEGGVPGERCNLVVDRGQVVGELELQTGRYRIQPVGSGSAHAVVEVKTAAFPSESEPKPTPR